MDRLQSAAQQLFNATNLVNASGNRLPSLASSGVKVVALYFSAHWCPPCRQFTPILKQAYQSFKQSPNANSQTGVVFVSGDRSLSDMKAYMRESHGDWPGVEPGSSLAMTLNSAFEVRGIPFLVVINDRGEVVSKEGRQEVMSLRGQAFESWNSSYVSLDTGVVDTLKDNPAEVTKEAGEILVKLLANVIRDPQNMKYRQIRLANPKIESKLLCANGAFEILFSVGFEEGTDTLILPFDANMNLIKAFKEKIEALLKPPAATAAASAVAPPTASQTAAAAAAPSTSSFQGSSRSASAVKGSESEFMAKIVNEHELSLRYEESDAQSAALKVIPVDEVKSKAKRKFDQLCQGDQSLKEKEAVVMKDLVVIQLLDWFKKDFFVWLDDVKCQEKVGCDAKLRPKRTDVANLVEASKGASLVEIFTCDKCLVEVRFPRYHSQPKHLLEWRKGRCGEWANCFALILRSMGYETRRVLDWTDHVWCEVYSQAENRWVHVDPCENAMDAPLTYECGWGKRLTYCIAVSKDEVQDVTWRYSKAKDQAERSQVLSRRTEVNEEWLTKTILQLNDKFQAGLDEATKKKLNERRVVEIVQLMMPSNRELSAAEKQGRQTGSLAWRLARGEAGKQASQEAFRLTKAEMEAKCFHLEYDAASDKYTRVSDNNGVIDGWQNGVKTCENVIRKEEHDWKMVYLARSEGSSKASLEWTLDTSGTGLSVKTVELCVNSKCYENGRVIWQLCGGNQCVLPTPGMTMKTEQLAGSKELKVGALLSGGKGDVAWQHTQLFRTEMTKHVPQLVLKVTLQQDDTSST